MKTDYSGIDYGLGKANIDNKTGIHYGVINQLEVLQAWCDSAEPYYGDPTCPNCDCQFEELDEDDKCPSCEHKVPHLDHCYGDSPISFFIDNAEYSAEAGEDGDIFITKSPFYGMCQYCSPCAPGAGYLMNECENGIKSYCLGHDFFESNKAPYTVYSVETGKVVEPSDYSK